MNPLFPLNTLGRVILILVAIVLGMIFSMMMWPEFWRKVFRGKKDEKK